MATPQEWGLTDRGFRRPLYTDLLDAIEHRAREQFGPGANLTVRSPLGLFLRIFAWALNILFSVLEEVYNSRFIDTAAGTSLYNLGRSIGLRLLPDQRALGYLEISGTPGQTVPSGWLASNVSGAQFVVMAKGVIGECGVALLPARAVKAGPEGNAASGTVTTPVNPGIPSGISAVTNPQPFEGGRLRETDAEYRERYYKSVDFAGGVNADAIRAEILQNVEGVHSAIVYENDTDFPDANGLPPHSFEAVVYGGMDTDIARQIFRRKAAGIQTHGSVTVPVLSAGGVAYDIKFSRPVGVDVWIRVQSLQTDPGRFPAYGVEQIQAVLVGYIGSHGKEGLDVGEDVYYNRLPCRVYAVPGVLDFDLTVSTDGIAYGRDNIPVGAREKAVTDESRVSVS